MPHDIPSAAAGVPEPVVRARWHAEAIDDLLPHVATDRVHGLSATEARGG